MKKSKVTRKSKVEKPKLKGSRPSSKRFDVGRKPQFDLREKPRDESLLSRVYGVNACKEFYKKNYNKIIRAFFTKNVAPQFSELMKKMAADKKVYRIVELEEIERVSQSHHHEGVCFNIQVDAPLNIEDWFKKEKGKKTSILLALENIGNPHNLGAIMRIAAHFGVSGIALDNPKTLQSGAAKRTAEGGAEYIEPVLYSNIKELVKAAKKEGYTIITTSSHGGRSLYETQFPDRAILFFGEEGDGLSRDAMSSAQVQIQIPGTQNVESLNVSSAIAVIFGEFWRQKRADQ